MADQIKGYRIFIASPRGLEDIRTNFVDTINEFWIDIGRPEQYAEANNLLAAA